jgi:hypothetical protein
MRPIQQSFSPWRRYAIGLSVLLSILAVLAIAAMVNYLARHYAPRFYWGSSSDYRLSPLTQVALASLTNQVRVTVFFDREDPVYPSVRALLREYAAHSPRLEIQELDYTQKPAEAQEFRRRFPFTIDPQDPDLILFESGSNTKIVPASDLRDYDVSALLRGASEIPPSAFKGEMLFTSAINAVCEGRRRKIYFLQGHREHDFQSEAIRTGYRRFAAILEEDNATVAGVDLRGGAEVPSDCELLIIAGPLDLIPDSELQSIDRYLRRGGRLLALFQFGTVTGLERFLDAWGLNVSDTRVIDPDSSEDPGLVTVSRFSGHPVTRPLGGTRVYLWLPRAVERRDLSHIHGAPARIEPLLLTGTNATAVSSRAGVDFRPGPQEPRSQIPLAAAVERGTLPGVSASPGATRIVVVGESSFLANSFIHEMPGNRHFIMSAVNWLLDRPHLLGGIQPTPIRSYQVRMTPFEHRMVRLLLLGVLPGSALFLGFIVWLRRH